MTRLLISLGTASYLALGGVMASGPDAGGRATDTDLCFEDDFPLAPHPQRPAPRPAQASPFVPAVPDAPRSSRAWLYWTLGLSAAAGGAAWFLHDAMVEPGTPRRRTEVFTDGAD